MWIELACQAIRQRKVLTLQYAGYVREVEAHCVGWTSVGHPVMRAGQIAGGSASGERHGWKLLRLDEATNALITDRPSEAPRRGFKSGDKAIARIVGEI